MKNSIQKPISKITFALIALMAFMSGCQGCGPSIPDSPDGTVKAITEGVENGKPEIIWEALPVSYQTDINGLVKQFAQKMDKELWNKGFDVAKKIATLAKEKKEFILGSPMLAQVQVKKEDLAKHWDAIVEMIQIMVESDLASLDDLKSFDGGKFLAGTGKELLIKGKDLRELAPEEAPKSFKDVKVEKVSESDKAATLKITYEKDTKTVELVKIEKRWVPKDLADQWTKMIAEAKEAIAKMSGEEIKKSKPQVMMMLAGVEAGIEQLKATKTQAEFDGIVQSLLMGGMLR